MNYSQYLNSFHWRDLRDAKLHSVNDRCEKCHRRSNLQVHHLTYERLGHERLTDLQVLCERCHEDAHNLFGKKKSKSKQKKRPKQSPPSNIQNSPSKKKKKKKAEPTNLFLLLIKALKG